MEYVNSALRAALPEMSVVVRAETAADLDFSASLYALTRTAELSVVPWPDEVKRAFCRQQFDAQHAHCRQHYPKAELLIIESDGLAVGRVYFELTAKELRLMEITLVEAVRNRGIGGAISDALLQRARAAAVSMSLHVEPFNPARHLYERQGFREIETRGLYLYMVCEPPAGAASGPPAGAMSEPPAGAMSEPPAGAMFEPPAGA